MYVVINQSAFVVQPVNVPISPSYCNLLFFNMYLPVYQGL